MEDKKTKRILEIVDEIIPPRLKKNCQEIHQIMEKTPMVYAKEMLDSLKEVFDMTQKQQQAGQKRAIAYISFSVLYSEILEGRYGLRIDVWTEELYLDEQEIYVYWEPRELFRYIEEDMNYLQRILSSSYIPLKEYEILELKIGYAANYYDILLRLISKLAPIIQKMKSFQVLERTKEVKVLVGEYMDTYQCVCKLADEVK